MKKLRHLFLETLENKKLKRELVRNSPGYPIKILYYSDEFISIDQSGGRSDMAFVTVHIDNIPELIKALEKFIEVKRNGKTKTN